jgi:hypothetical protein
MLSEHRADARPSAHGGKKEDGGDDKRVSSEHGFGELISSVTHACTHATC